LPSPDPMPGSLGGELRLYIVVRIGPVCSPPLPATGRQGQAGSAVRYK